MSIERETRRIQRGFGQWIWYFLIVTVLGIVISIAWWMMIIFGLEVDTNIILFGAFAAIVSILAMFWAFGLSWEKVKK